MRRQAGYSGLVPGDQMYSSGITDTGGVALIDASGAVVDQVGMNAGSAYSEGTVLAAANPGDIVISEFRTRGPNGGNDEFVELYNRSAFVLDLSGMKILGSNTAGATSARLTIDAGTLLAPGCHFLATNGSTAYSGVIAGDQTYGTGITDDGVSTGLEVTADLTPIGGGATDTLFDDGTNGDAVAGDLVFSRLVTVAPATPAGALSLAAHVTDGQARTGAVSIGLTIIPPPPPDRPIHEIQGSGPTSPFAGQLVATTGVVTATTGNGFFIQTPDAQVDADPATSEGLFVFTSSTLPAAAVVGNDVRVIGTVSEYVPSADPASPPVTEISNAAATPVPDPRPDQVTVASFNMERFFDTANDPATSDAVLTAEAFERRLSKASLAIRHEMKAPDIIGVEEMENLSTLQAVAARVNADAVAAGGPDPGYAAYLVEGNDIGGIDVGLLVKASRVTVVDVTQVGADATYLDPVSNAPALLNDRPPLVLRAVIPSPAGHPFPVTVIVNHLRSLPSTSSSAGGVSTRSRSPAPTAPAGSRAARCRCGCRTAWAGSDGMTTE